MKPEKELNLKIVDRWDNLEFSKRPQMANDTVKIAEWDNVSPKEHLWVRLKFRYIKDNEIHLDSDFFIQLAKILEAI